MRSASFCLVKGQETQLGWEQEVKTAEHIVLLSTLKLGIALALTLRPHKVCEDEQEAKF